VDVAVTRRETIYMLKESGGTMRTNDPGAASVLEFVGFRQCTREEYRAMERRMQREEVRRFQDGLDTEEVWGRE
jgi:hypothetical protein